MLRISGTRILCYISAICLVVTHLSCSDNSSGKKTTSITPNTVKTDDEQYIGLPAADTILIDKTAAVFFTADSLHIAKFKTQFGEAAYDGTDHECFYQMKNSRTSLQEHWQQVTIYQVKTNSVLVFLKEAGNTVIIDLRLKNDLCGLYIFNRKKDPLLADMMGIGTSLETYFLK